MPTVLEPAAEQRLVLYNVSWEEYEGLLRSLGDRRLRHTYDHGTLELMSPTRKHEWVKSVLADFVATICRVQRIPRLSIGSTTFRKKTWKRGFEADEGFYVGRENVRRGRRWKRFNPDRDLPPNLFIEVDIASSSRERMEIYERLGVPEVWRFDGKRVRFYLLSKQQVYQEVRRSSLFGFVSAADLTRILSLHDMTDDTEMESQFESWVRGQIGE